MVNMSETSLRIRGQLIIRHVRVQNANALSSPLTWGWPAMTAFLGLGIRLERTVGAAAGVQFLGVGTVCHQFDAQVSEGGYTRAFAQQRQPLGPKGETLGIVEEARAHFTVSLVFAVDFPASMSDPAARQAFADRCVAQLASLRVAGGSVLPSKGGAVPRWARAALVLQPSDDDDGLRRGRRLLRSLLPGFALVARPDLLADRLAELRAVDSRTDALDAWMDLSCRTYVPIAPEHAEGEGEISAGNSNKVRWVAPARPGWIVPIPVGYRALTEVLPPGSVARARDTVSPFRFVETIWSIGQWISPHRLGSLNDLIWRAEPPDDHGRYRCTNDFAPRASESDPMSASSKP